MNAARTEEIFAIVKANPGFAAADIWLALRARMWVVRIFGRDSLMAALFGGNIRKIYAHLDCLERTGRIRGDWHPFAPANSNRHRAYFVTEAA